MIQVNEENIPVLLRHGKTEHFDGFDELPVKGDLLTTLKAQAEMDFDGRTAKEVKSDFDQLGIDYSARAGLKTLAKIIREL